MSESRLEQVIARRGDALQRNIQKSGGLSAWSVVTGAALVLLAAAVIVNLPDIKRYIKISTM
jgi:hypothetical protein